MLDVWVNEGFQLFVGMLSKSGRPEASNKITEYFKVRAAAALLIVRLTDS